MEELNDADSCESSLQDMSPSSPKPPPPSGKGKGVSSVKGKGKGDGKGKGGKPNPLTPSSVGSGRQEYGPLRTQADSRLHHKAERNHSVLCRHKTLERETPK